MALRALNLGAGVTVRNTSYDFAGQPTSQAGANGHTYLALGSGPTDMSRDITDASIISNVLSTEFKNILTTLGLTVLHIEIYKIPANYDGVPGLVVTENAAGIIESWDGDSLTTGCYDVTGLTEVSGEGDSKVYVSPGADGTNEANWKHVSNLTAHCTVTSASPPTVLEFHKPVNSSNGAGGVGWAICVFITGVATISEYETTFADYLG